jgi:hypothetical protein
MPSDGACRGFLTGLESRGGTYRWRACHADLADRWQLVRHLQEPVRELKHFFKHDCSMALASLLHHKFRVGPVRACADLEEIFMLCCWDSSL